MLTYISPIGKYTSTSTYFPMLILRTMSLFWSTLKIVSLVRAPMPSGRVSMRFCERWRSVRLVRPDRPSGTSSSLFSLTSRQRRFLRRPVSGGRCDIWLWSSHSSWRAGNSPMCGGWSEEDTVLSNACNSPFNKLLFRNVNASNSMTF